MKTEIKTRELEQLVRECTYHKNRLDEKRYEMNVHIKTLQGFLQKELNAKRFIIPEGTTQIEFAYKFYMNVTRVENIITKVEPVYNVDLSELLVDVPEPVQSVDLNNVPYVDESGVQIHAIPASELGER